MDFNNPLPSQQVFYIIDSNLQKITHVRVVWLPRTGNTVLHSGSDNQNMPLFTETTFSLLQARLDAFTESCSNGRTGAGAKLKWKSLSGVWLIRLVSLHKLIKINLNLHLMFPLHTTIQFVAQENLFASACWCIIPQFLFQIRLCISNVFACLASADKMTR